MEAELEEEPWHQERGNSADMTEEEQMGREDMYDHLTGRILKYEHVARSRLCCPRSKPKKTGVWGTVPLLQRMERSCRKPMRGKWVDINKADEVDHNYRSRHAAQEVRQAHGGAHREGLLAAMPSTEEFKPAISRAVTANRAGKIRSRKLLLMDR